MSAVDPAAMWAYATAPIGEPTSEPHRDPDAPLHAVLAAANAVAPRCRLEEGTALVHARYEYPAGRPEVTSEDLRADVADLKPWSIRDAEGNELGIYWSELWAVGVHAPAVYPDGIEAREITDPVQVSLMREAMQRASVYPPRTSRDEIREAKRRTRRDVAAVIT